MRLPRLRRAGADGYAGLGEEAVLGRLFAGLGVDRGQVVDIAACDGVTRSNALALYEQGWPGLAVEGDPDRFARLAAAYRRFPDVGLARTWVTPGNVAALLEAHGLPRDFTYLSLDIDGYDHFVLAALLEAYRPVVVCAEINEKIPPPVKFTVTYDPDYAWAVDHFYGQSISKLHELCEARDYALVELHYNNAFLVSGERNVFHRLSPEEAYRTGYLDRPDRLQHFPGNADMEAVHGLEPVQAIAFLNERFARYAGRYEIGL
jgi:hypothetical protein